MIKYDYKKFIADNSEGQKFIESEILASLGAYCIDYGASEENPYVCDICFASSYLPPGKKREKMLLYNIRLSQNGAKLVLLKQQEYKYPNKIIIEASEKLLKIASALKQYEFEAYAMEFWTDSVAPYYIPKNKKSLCSNVVIIEGVKEC